MLAGCASTGGAAREPAPAPAAQGRIPAGEEGAAYEKARPVFEAYCAKCHTTEGSRSTPKALEHFNMDSYPFGGHHAQQITQTLRGALGVGGRLATMPVDKPGAVKGEELKLILAWASAYDRAHASAGAPKKHEHDHGSGDDHVGPGHAH